MAVSLLRQLLAILKALIICGRRLLKETWGRLLRKIAFLYTILRSRLQIGSQRRPHDTKKAPRLLHPTITPNTQDPFDKPIHDTAITNSTTLTTTKDDIIRLDSSISCSLHPYPYLDHNLSRSSLNLGLHAARSSHTSRNASLSMQELNISTTPSDSQSIEDYTFTIKTPDHPITPITRRQYSLSSPQLGSGSGTGGENAVGEGNAPGYLEFEVERTHSSSPAESVLALPTGQVYSPHASVHGNINGSVHAGSIHGSLPAGSIHGSVPAGSVHGSVHDLNLAHDRIFPIVPEYFQRYDRTSFAEPRDTQLTIKSLTMDFRAYPDPPGWKPIVHPEGVLYFYNEDKHAVTEANLHNPIYYRQIMDDIHTLEDFMRANGVLLPDSYTLAMDLNMQPHGEIYTDYYFADHNNRTIFFLDDVAAQDNFMVWHHVKGVTSLAHIRHEVEAQYWNHGMLYPSTVEVTTQRIADLRDIILHYIGDATTSQYSTSPYVLADLNTMLSQVNDLEKNTGPRYIGASSLLCRMMLVFARQRFYNWHGLPEARIYRDQSVHGKSDKRRTYLIKILSPLLFSAPDTHLTNLEKMWVDKIMHGAVWLQSINKLNAEWQEFTLYGTVLLNANVAFLAIQSIDVNRNPYRSPVQVASYVSIVASIGSIILGLLLMRQNSTRADGTAAEVCAFLKARSHPTLGLETLAILYSLPYALLLWAMASFLAAFAWNCFDDSDFGTRAVMGVAWMAFAILVLWCIWMGWVKHETGNTPSNDDPVSGSGSSGSKKEPDNSSKGSLPNGGNAGSDDAQGGRAAAIVKNFKIWTWPARFFADRRGSYDSQRTAVQQAV